MLGVVFALPAVVVGGSTLPRAHVLRAATPRMDLPADLGSLFEDKPPPSWGSPEWQWGSADGAAHEVAARVRAEFEKPHRRSAFLTYARCGSADLVDLKMALALKCQRAKSAWLDPSTSALPLAVCWLLVCPPLTQRPTDRDSAADMAYDDADGRWAALELLIERAEFEHEGLIELNKLAAAVNERLPTPLDDEDVREQPTGVIAEGMAHLGFVEKGID
jgi:hypothetical protein